MLNKILLPIFIFLIAFSANAQRGSLPASSPSLIPQTVTPTPGSGFNCGFVQCVTPTPTPVNSPTPITGYNECFGYPNGPVNILTGQEGAPMGVDICNDNNPCTIDSCTLGFHTGINYYQGDDEVGYPLGQEQFCIDNYPACEVYYYPKCSNSYFCPSSGSYCPKSYIISGGHYLGSVPEGYCGIVSPPPASSPGTTPTVSIIPSPSATPFEPCIPTFCDAGEPACGQQTYGKDSCGNDCQIDGGVCLASPSSTPISASTTPSFSSPTPSSSPSLSLSPTFTPISSVGNNPPTLFNIVVDQPNYCQTGLNIAVNVRWSFADIEGDSQQSYQVQIDTDSNFGSPDVDTGEVFSPTRASGFIGSGKLKYAQRYYARVRARDTSGALSTWY